MKFEIFLALVAIVLTLMFLILPLPLMLASLYCLFSGDIYGFVNFLVLFFISTVFSKGAYEIMEMF
jgi:hypothetical protein